jgi:hypothetical protein
VFTALTPASLLISCKLSFPIVGLKMSSLPTLALKSLNEHNLNEEKNYLVVKLEYLKNYSYIHIYKLINSLVVEPGD